jgi:hypothetical protein
VSQAKHRSGRVLNSTRLCGSCQTASALWPTISRTRSVLTVKWTHSAVQAGQADSACARRAVSLHSCLLSTQHQTMSMGL